MNKILFTFIIIIAILIFVAICIFFRRNYLAVALFGSMNLFVTAILSNSFPLEVGLKRGDFFILFNKNSEVQYPLIILSFAAFIIYGAFYLIREIRLARIENETKINLEKIKSLGQGTDFKIDSSSKNPEMEKSDSCNDDTSDPEPKLP